MNNFFSSVVPFLPVALAQMTPGEADPVVWWIIGLAGTAVLVNQVATAWQKVTGNLKERPTPSETYQRISVCEKEHKRIDENIDRIARQITEGLESLRLEFKRDGAGVHDKINRVAERVGELTGEIKRMGKQ